MNDLVKEKSNVKSATLSPQHNLIIASEIADNIKHDEQEQHLKSKEINSAIEDDDDDFMLNASSTTDKSQQPSENTEHKEIIAMAAANSLPQKALSEINIDLDDITSTGEERLLLDDDDVKITLNLTSEKPCRNVSVIVICATNKSKLPLNDFQFEASVKKVSNYCNEYCNF